MRINRQINKSVKLLCKRTKNTTKGTGMFKEQFRKGVEQHTKIQRTILKNPNQHLEQRVKVKSQKEISRYKKRQVMRINRQIN